MNPPKVTVLVAEKKMTLRQGFNLVAGTLIMLFLFGGCMYRVFTPMSCSESRSALADAESDYEGAMGSGSDRLLAARSQGYIDAMAQESEACY